MNHKSPIILHFHIFKNAGTTIDWILRKNFPNSFFQYDDHNDQTITFPITILNNFLKTKNPNAVSSHQIRFPIMHDFYHFLPIVFIRHPIDRALSMYEFKRKEYRFSPSILKARTLNLKQFVEWSLECDVYKEMKNFQTRFLSHQDNISDVTLDDFNLAVERMKGCDVIGVVERMDESLVVAENVLMRYFPSIDLSYIKQNINPHRIENMEDRLAYINSQLGDSLMKQLVEYNALDFQLHLETIKELNQRISRIVDFENKLSEFKVRCKKLENDVPN